MSRDGIRRLDAGTRVTTPDGTGKVVGPWLSRGLARHGPLEPDGWIVALDNGKRRIFADTQITHTPDK